MHSWAVRKNLVWLAMAPLFATIAIPKFGCGQQQDDHQLTGPVATVGNPQDPDSLGKEVADAYAAGSRRIVIRSGTYNFSLSHHSILNLDGWHDARLSGHSVTLVSSETDWGNELIHMSMCSNVQIDGLTLSQSWQTASQGKVTSVSQANGKTTCIWRPDKGYPLPDPGAAHMNKGPNVVDAKTRLLKQGVGDQWDAGLSDNGDGTYQVSFSRVINLAVGDWLVARGKAAPCKLDLLNCHGCAISNIVFLRNAFASLREDKGGGNSYSECHWQLGPKPDDATEKPLVSCSVDGFHSTEAYPGPDIENCDFSGVLLDDCITVHGFLQEVKSSNGDTIVVDGDGGKLRSGQPIRIGAPGFFKNAFVKFVAPNTDHTATVTLDQDLGVPVGAKVSNPLWNGQSFKVLNCHIGFTRSRGILVKADEGLIQGNVITDCGASGVSAGPEYDWKEGDYVQDLAIKDNQFIRNGFTGNRNAAVLIHGEGAKGNHNITIEGNTFESNFSGDISVAWTNGATMEHNNFTSPSSIPIGLHSPTAVTLASSSDVRFLQNLFKNSTTYSKPVVSVAPSVDGMQDDSQGRGQ
jgi:hypothetical protein